MFGDRKDIVSWESLPYIDFQLILFQRVCQLRLEKSIEQTNEPKGILIRPGDDSDTAKPLRKKVRFDADFNSAKAPRNTKRQENNELSSPLGSPYNKYPFYPFDISFPVPSSAEILAEYRAQVLAEHRTQKATQAVPKDQSM
ncbi:hypothetical protein EYR40_002759 [Pleurotus pulmonarius]|nr:hypothetical protein EYR40_002759 [Pleurotus pulmonarius]KAF4582390.1 hypothetical protein EYR38_002510 [Pleurotus pulmonarius]